MADKDSDMINPDPSLGRKIKEIVIGGARSPQESGVFHKLSLVAFFAWIGLGADGLSSSCYGPEEAFGALGSHAYLSIFVALATAFTIFVIANSYSQIIELFPSGGGGYVVASKLLSPKLGMVSGCALLVDYVLTITVSVASGSDALFSFLPMQYASYKLAFAVLTVGVLTVMNLRGVRESVRPLVPIFLIFLATHVFVIIYSFIFHADRLPDVWSSTVNQTHAVSSEYGALGTLMIVLLAYSMGAGTYTGIEAVSNGMAILREPRVKTARRTMQYMWISLAFVAVGLMVAYLLFQVDYKYAKSMDKTLNAVLLERIASGWTGGQAFIIVTLISEATLLFVAAQTGFLGGPRVLASMALDRWFPTRLSMLSDRLVTKNGIVLMAVAAGITMIATGGSVRKLVVLYSINVFISFVLSQTGMVRHWWTNRRSDKRSRKGLFINGSGLALSAFILVMIVIVKFHEGGWITLVVTGALITLASLIRRHYNHSRKMLDQFNTLALSAVNMPPSQAAEAPQPPKEPDPEAKTAVLLVTGFNGMGIHALMNIFRFFGDTFKNFVFVRVGVVDAENFKGANEVNHLKDFVRLDTEKYVQFMNRQGFYSQAVTSVGADIVDEIECLAAKIVQKYPQSIFFAGQLLFPNDSSLTRLLHNNITFALQRRLYHRGVPFMMLPIRVMTGAPPRPPGVTSATR